MFFKTALCEETQQMVRGFPAVCAFLNDELNAVVYSPHSVPGILVLLLPEYYMALGCRLMTYDPQWNAE